MNFRKVLIVVLCFGLISVGGNGGILSPSNFDECILENIKSASTQVATLEVKKICARLHSNTIPVTEVDMLVHAVNVGELLSLRQYEVLHTKYYSDMKVVDYFKAAYSKRNPVKYGKMSYEQFEVAIRR